MIDANLCQQVAELVECDRRISHCEIAERTGLSKGTMITILHDHLNFRKVVARWVPHSLSDDMHRRRVDVCNGPTGEKARELSQELLQGRDLGPLP